MVVVAVVVCTIATAIVDIIAVTMMIIDAVLHYTLLQRQGKGQSTLVAYAVGTEVQIL